MDIELTPTELMEAKLENLIEMQQYIAFEACEEIEKENQYTAIYNIQSVNQNNKIENVNNDTVDKENHTVIRKPRIANIEATKESPATDLDNELSSSEIDKTEESDSDTNES
ncbi:4347_t:CDS:2, partial [Gigaspora rosea]